MRLFVACAVFVMLLALRGSGTIAAPGAASRSSLRDLDAFIANALREYRVPGAAVAVVENDKVVLLKGYGVRDLSTKAKVDCNTVFQLASVSKTFAAVAAAILVDEGRLTWDAPIVTYLPQFVAYAPYVTQHMTLRDLLAHRTGWPQYSGDMLGLLGYSRPEVVRRLRYAKPAYSFREVAQYFNPAFLVAGEVTARAAGMSWDQFVKRRIFSPLGMTRSSTALAGIADANNAKPYALVDGAPTWPIICNSFSPGAPLPGSTSSSRRPSRRSPSAAW